MQVVDHIRAAKARSALEGHAPMGWAIGYACLARDSGGCWAAATVTAVTADGHFQVLWLEGSEVGVVHKVDCRPQDTGVCPLLLLLLLTLPASQHFLHGPPRRGREDRQVVVDLRCHPSCHVPAVWTAPICPV
jgi:hypothetical protein